MLLRIEILDRGLGPHELPTAIGIAQPAAPIHVGLIPLIGLRRLIVVFDQSLFDRVQVQRRPPLHAIAGEALFLARDAAELNDLEGLDERSRQLGQPVAHLLRGHHVPIFRPGILDHKTVGRAVFARLVPVFRGRKGSRSLRCPPRARLLNGTPCRTGPAIGALLRSWGTGPRL